jgi:hypothetical protein
MSNYQRPPVIFHRKFTRPRFIVYKVGDPSPFKFVWNRYDTATIGAAIVDRFASGQPNRGKGGESVVQEIRDWFIRACNKAPLIPPSTTTTKENS